MKTEREHAENEHKKIHQTGSKALWGARCRNQNETRLPLLEKAFAKAHGDYASLVGGWPGYAFTFVLFFEGKLYLLQNKPDTN